jgi:hypothetical protein
MSTARKSCWDDSVAAPQLLLQLRFRDASIGGVRFGLSGSLLDQFCSLLLALRRGVYKAMGIWGATLLVLLAAACIAVGTAIGKRYPLSRAASKAALAGWGLGIVCGLAAFACLVQFQ